MLKGYAQADYSPENWKLLLDIKAEADTQIDNAATIEDVTAALDTAEAAMAAVYTLLDDAKAAAHATLNAALAGYAEKDYSPENWTLLLNAMAAAAPDDAACVTDITEAVNAAEAAMAAVHTLLFDAKAAAHAGLDTALAAHSDADYTPENWAALAGFKSAGDTAIDEATDLAGVEAALSAATAGMDGVQTIAQALAEAKAAAHEALAEALGVCECCCAGEECCAPAEAEETVDEAGEAAEPCEETAEPAEDAAEPCEETGEQTGDATEPCEETGEPVVSATEPCEETGEPATAVFPDGAAEPEAGDAAAEAAPESEKAE